MSEHDTITVVIPAYNEEQAIGTVVEGVRRACAGLPGEWSILVVDDGSTDRTGDAAREAGAEVIAHPYNRGYGASLKTGIRAASGHSVLILDADGQHDPADIPRLLAERGRYDMVVGARRRSQGSPLWRKPGKLALGWLVNQLTGHTIPDFNSGFRIMDRAMALRFLPLMPDGFSFSTTSTIAAFKAGYTVGYVPIQVAARVGKSMVKLSDGYKTLMLIIRLVTLFAPLRVFLPLSAATMVVGLAFVVNGYATLGEASLKGIVVILASLLFFGFGILVDQVVAIRRGEHIR